MSNKSRLRGRLEWLRWLAWTALAIPFVTGSLAMLMFCLQGGFGAGHGDLDLPIFLLGMPASLGLCLLPFPIPEFVQKHDVLLVVAYPLFLNVVFFWVPISYLISRISESSRPEQE